MSAEKRAAVLAALQRCQAEIAAIADGELDDVALAWTVVAPDDRDAELSGVYAMRLKASGYLCRPCKHAGLVWGSLVQCVNESTEPGVQSIPMIAMGDGDRQ